MVLLKILGAILFGALVVAVTLFCAIAIMSLVCFIWQKVEKFSVVCIIGKILKWIGIIIFSIIAIVVFGTYLFAIGAGALESLFGIAIVL